MTRGFTLLETLIYMALLGLLMTGALIAGYSLILNTQNDARRTSIQDEGSFAERKFLWAMNGMTVTPTFGGFGCDGTISFTKTGENNPIEFRRSTVGARGVIEMREGGSGAYVPLTSDTISATCLRTTQIAAIGTGPSGANILFTLKQAGNDASTFDFTMTRYVRQ